MPEFSTRSAILCLTVVAASSTTLIISRNALARDEGSKTVLALDLDFASSVKEPGTGDGAGGALRIGRKLDLMVLSLTPEFGASYHHFAGTYGSRVYRGFLGGRLGLGKVFEPSVFAHVGLGKLSASVAERTAPAFDAGLAFDITLLPLIDFGAHASYNALLPADNYSAFDWYQLGLHAALVF
jgi:hypothetical protein